VKTFLAGAILIAVLVLGHSTPAQNVEFQKYDGSDFTVGFLARRDVNSSLKHQIADDGSPYTARVFYQDVQDNTFAVVELDYSTERGDDKENLDNGLHALVASYKTVGSARYFDSKLGILNAREVACVVRIDGTNYIMVQRIAARGKRMWEVSVLIKDSDKYKSADIRAFLDSFQVE